MRLVVRLGSEVVAARVLQASAASDLTVQSRITGLRPGRRYTYLFTRGRRVSETGTFTTAPAPTADRRIRFAITGDADATPTESGGLGFNRFQIYARMAAERNDFNINLGDTIYSDSGVGGLPAAKTAAEKWAKYKLGLALPALRTLRASAGLYSHWDDHEFVNDFSRAEHGDAIYAAGVKAFRDYSPVAYSRGLGLYRSVRWGKHLELFFLDERSFRSAKATSACGNDLAPTAPQPVRDAFASLAPGSEEPRAARLPRRDQRSRSHDARRTSVRGVHERDRGLDRDLEGHRERGSDPAVLRAALRPLGGLRRRARPAAALPAGEREERRLPRPPTRTGT